MSKNFLALACAFIALPLWADVLPKVAPTATPIKRLGATAFLLPEETRHLALAPNGETMAALAAMGEDTEVVLFNTKTGERRRSFMVPKTSVNAVTFSADSQELFLVDWDQLKRYTVQGVARPAIDLKDVVTRTPALSMDQQTIALHATTETIDRDILLFSTKTGRRIAKLPSKGTWCKAMQFSTAGDKLLAAMDIGTRSDTGNLQYSSNPAMAIVAIDIKAQRIVGEMKTEGEQRLALSSDGETIAYCGRNEDTIKIVNLVTNKERATIKLKPMELQFTPDGTHLITVDERGQTTLWNATTGAKVHDMAGLLTNQGFNIVGSAGGLIVARDGGWRSTAKFVVWDAKGQRVGKPISHEGAVTHVAYTPDGKQLVTGSIDHTVRLWDVATGNHLKLLTTFPGEVKSLAVAPNGKFIAAGCKTGVVRLTRLADGESTPLVSTQPQEPLSLAFSPDGGTLYVGGSKQHVDVWHLTEPATHTTIPLGGTGRTLRLERWLLTADNEEYFEAKEANFSLWQPGHKQSSHRITLKDENKDNWTGSIRCASAAFSADGRFLATSQISEYQGIRPSYGAARLMLWEASSGQSLRVFAPVVSETLALSPNGRLLAATSEGRSGHLRVGYGSTLEIWDMLTGAKLDTLPIVPVSMAFSPDGRFLATGGRDHGVSIWKAPTPTLPKVTTYPARVVESWWLALNGDAHPAHQAIGQMLAAPDVAVELLRSKVQPVVAVDAKIAQDLIAKLDSDKFGERELAEKKLRELGEQVTHFIVAALANKPGAELRARLERLQNADVTPERRRQQRAIAALEWLATKEAKEHLTKLATGAPNAFITREATAALERLGDK